MEPFDLNENIIVRLGLQKLPEEKRIKMLEQMTDIIIQRVMLRMMENLPTDEINEANALADKPEALIAFLSGKVEDFYGLLSSEINAVKSELVLEAAVPENLV
jgi:hypothetical protein